STLAWGTVGCLADFEGWVYEARLAGSTPARPTGSVRRRPGPGDTDTGSLATGRAPPLWPLDEERVAKIKGKRGFRFIKELGGAIRRETVSKTARFLEGNRLLRGRVLDYGCGFGFDADHFGWEAYDPHYRQKLPEGVFDTIVCNHVANMLTRDSRQGLFRAIQALLTPKGKAYLSVSRKIPMAGKIAMRKRIQNYVVLTLPSLFCDDELEIYRLAADSVF